MASKHAVMSTTCTCLCVCVSVCMCAFETKHSSFTSKTLVLILSVKAFTLQRIFKAHKPFFFSFFRQQLEKTLDEEHKKVSHSSSTRKTWSRWSFPHVFLMLLSFCNGKKKMWETYEAYRRQFFILLCIEIKENVKSFFFSLFLKLFIL